MGMLLLTTYVSTVHTSMGGYVINNMTTYVHITPLWVDMLLLTTCIQHAHHTIMSENMLLFHNNTSTNNISD